MGADHSSAHNGPLRVAAIARYLSQSIPKVAYSTTADTGLEANPSVGFVIETDCGLTIVFVKFSNPPAEAPASAGFALNIRIPEINAMIDQGIRNLAAVL